MLSLVIVSRDLVILHSLYSVANTCIQLPICTPIISDATCQKIWRQLHILLTLLLPFLIIRFFRRLSWVGTCSRAQTARLYRSHVGCNLHFVTATQFQLSHNCDNVTVTPFYSSQFPLLFMDLDGGGDYIRLDDITVILDQERRTVDIFKNEQVCN